MLAYAVSISRRQPPCCSHLVCVCVRARARASPYTRGLLWRQDAKELVTEIKTGLEQLNKLTDKKSVCIQTLTPI